MKKVARYSIFRVLLIYGMVAIMIYGVVSSIFRVNWNLIAAMSSTRYGALYPVALTGILYFVYLFILFCYSLIFKQGCAIYIKDRKLIFFGNIIKRIKLSDIKDVLSFGDSLNLGSRGVSVVTSCDKIYMIRTFVMVESVEDIIATISSELPHR